MKKYNFKFNLKQRFKTEIDENWDEKFSIYLTINIYLKALKRID